MATPWPGTFALGCDYNPEQWPSSVWDEDIHLMQEVGITYVNLAIFSWALLEKADGQFDFSWLDDIIERLHAGGITVDLGTATATPPAWLVVAHPEILPVTSTGVTLGHGGRQHWCANSAVFRRYALRLTEALARRYGEHPALRMWHVSNEYGGSNLPCYCDRCAAAFRSWLQRRYESIEALNTAWGTAVWSQAYGDWTQIQPPRKAPTELNPTQVLDYARFGSDSQLDFYRAEADILRALSPDVPVTTNFMTLAQFQKLEYTSWAAAVDVVCTDHYLTADFRRPSAELAFSGDLTRGLAGGSGWILMEHAPSAVNWQHTNTAKDPGQTIRDVIAHVARGADSVGWFQWRQSAVGPERFHSGIIPHAGADTDRFREVVEVGAIATRLGEVVGSRVESSVAILHDYESNWASMGLGVPNLSLGPLDTAHAIHAVLRDHGVTCDVVHPSANLSGYRLIIVPALPLITDEHAAAISAAAHAGAHVLVTFYSGIVDENDHVRLGGYPGAFRDLLSVRVEEFFPLRAGTEIGYAAAEDSGTVGAGRGRLWSENVKVVDAEVIAAYADKPLDGRPAITRRTVGAGVAWYLSTLPDDVALAELLDVVVSTAGVQVYPDADSDFEITRRTRDERSWLFAVNHGSKPRTVRASGFDLVTNRAVGAEILVAPGACVVVREVY